MAEPGFANKFNSKYITQQSDPMVYNCCLYVIINRAFLYPVNALIWQVSFTLPLKPPCYMFSRPKKTRILDFINFSHSLVKLITERDNAGENNHAFRRVLGNHHLTNSPVYTRVERSFIKILSLFKKKNLRGQKEQKRKSHHSFNFNFVQKNYKFKYS